MKKLISLIFMLLSVSTWAESSITAEDLPPWLKPELLVHIADMNMNKDQNIAFRMGLKECLSGLQTVVKREIRKGGINIPKRIRRGVNREYNQFDESMKEILAKSQIKPWSLYLEGLKKVMAERSVNR